MSDGESIQDKKFHEWTDGLTPKEQRISVFYHVRDIPYKLITSLYDPDNAVQGALEANGGSCTPKHFLLGHMFQMLDIPVKYASFTFNWNDPEVHYPDDLREMADKLPAEYHLSCLAFINEKWVLVDATWDTPLERAGLPINHSWDGESDTLNAVHPIETAYHDTIWERNDYTTVKRGTWGAETIQRRDEFFEAFNAWVEGFRDE